MDAADATAHGAVLPSLPGALPAAEAPARAAPRARSRFSSRGREDRRSVLARRVGATHPVRVFLLVVVVGYALLAALTDLRRVFC